MSTILLDTDIVVDLLRGKVPIRNRIDEILMNGIALSVTPITWAEIHSGIRRGEEETVRQFFDSVRNLSIESSMGKRAGEYLRLYGKSHGVRLADALIAATASVLQIMLFTMNRKHYPMKDVDLYPS